VFRHHTNSVKLLLSVFGHGWPRWKWITVWKRLADVFKFCACILQKSLKTYYGLLSLQKFTWYPPLDVPGAFCVWVKAFNLNFSAVLTRREQNPRDTAPLSRLKATPDLRGSPRGKNSYARDFKGKHGKLYIVGKLNKCRFRRKKYKMAGFFNSTKENHKQPRKWPCVVQLN